MVFLDSSVGPSFEAVRPTRAAVPDIRFPVYDDLTDRLVNPGVDPATGEPDALTAHVLAVAAGYAYSDGQTVAEMMTRLGMEKCTCLTVSFRNDTMFVASTAHVLQSKDGRVVLVAFRGTEPVNLIDTSCTRRFEPPDAGTRIQQTSSALPISKAATRAMICSSSTDSANTVAHLPPPRDRELNGVAVWGTTKATNRI